MEAAEKIAVVEKYIEAFDKVDIELIKEIYADEGVVEDPVGTDTHNGIDAIVEFYSGAMNPGVKLALTGPPRCAGNAVAFPFQANAGGMTVNIIDVFEFNDDGKVVSMKAYWGPENMVS